MVQYSNEQLLESLRECKQRHGEINTQILNNDDNLPSGPTYSYRFDSLADAAERAGLKKEAEKLKQNQRERIGYTESEIIDFIERIADDGVVTPKMIAENDGPSTTSVSNYLGTNSLVGESVGDVSIISHTEYSKPSKQKVRDELISLSEENDTVTRTTLSNADISVSDVQYHYDSIVNARDVLGIPHPSQSERASIESPYEYVYVIERDDKLYVGKSTDPIERIREHAREHNVSLERIVKVPDDRDAQDFEREMSMKIAREYNRTDIEGGK